MNLMFTDLKISTESNNELFSKHSPLIINDGSKDSMAFFYATI